MKYHKKFICEDLKRYLMEHPEITPDEMAKFFHGTTAGLYSAFSRCGIRSPFTDRDTIDSQKIIDYVVSHPASTTHEIATALNYRYNTVYKALKRLGQFHLVKRDSAKGGPPRKYHSPSS